MSHSTPFKFTRRAMLAGTAAGVAALATPIGFAVAADKANTRLAFNNSSSVCANHHRELSQHLGQVLNSLHVDERAKNTMLRTTVCPHCQVGIHPADPANGQFTAIAA